MKTRRHVLLAAMLCAGAMLCQGLVYERSGAASDSTRALVSSGGTLAYETPVTINGGKGSLAVLGFNKSLPSLVRELGQLFNTRDITYPGGTMGFVTARNGGFITRMTVLSLGNPLQTLVLKIQQSETDFQSSTRTPALQLLPGIPDFPGSEPVFCATDEKSNAALSVARTASEPSSVRSFYTSALTASGWTPTLPASFTPPSGPGMMVFSKDRALCCVMVDASLTDGKNRITILHKQQGIE